MLAGSESIGGNLKTPKSMTYGFRQRNSCHVVVPTENSRTNKPMGTVVLPLETSSIACGPRVSVEFV